MFPEFQVGFSVCKKTLHIQISDHRFEIILQLLQLHHLRISEKRKNGLCNDNKSTKFFGCDLIIFLAKKKKILIVC